MFDHFPCQPKKTLSVFFAALCGSDSTGPGIRGPQLQRERSEKCSESFLLTISLHHTHSISSFPQITGVSILRAGETMEPALRAVCKDVRIGKILIQTNLDSGEPELHYLRLPKDISEDHVILMDSTISTGAAAMMAVRVLLDHEVQEDKIMLVSLLMAQLGVHSVAYAFPKVKIITTAVDKDLDEFFHVIPGIGVTPYK
ncbi:Uridine-cytidine kinase-like 1 [Characodon lateralis]|uniref:Uridine-cytidine kinase-like 1 n=1 Tax=Characodon lateralis TaxID=208331 RepID=A0ABU7EWG0_9TELE|nr:Uridine-cytidine kinase-like 1 [Characodon lateralis]